MTPTEDKTKIAVIQKDISDIKTVLREGYATKDSLADVAKETERRITRLENASNLWKWLSPSLAAVLGSSLTLLIIEFLKSR